ncbi:GntR family transcriptional regulator [Streptomyces sp. NPDC059063]|uniref:GntR family transcriptional regulator n=1 Tax=unclassified Streptomyces TaxID=2593676 RepID=UPI0036A07DD0
MPIERRPLREQVKEELLERLARGEFVTGETVNELQLAAELGVSRTPLREALITLEREGVITSERGKGFRFTAMSPEEFRDLTVIVAALEALALELSDPAHLRSIAPRLRADARAIAEPGAPGDAAERYEDAWRDLLLSGCPNGRLRDHIASLKLTTRRYQRLVAGDRDLLARSAAEHERIADHLLRDDVPGAVAALKENWTNGMERILKRLEV